MCIYIYIYITKTACIHKDMLIYIYIYIYEGLGNKPVGDKPSGSLHRSSKASARNLQPELAGWRASGFTPSILPKAKKPRLQKHPKARAQQP